MAGLNLKAQGTHITSDDRLIFAVEVLNDAGEPGLGLKKDDRDLAETDRAKKADLLRLAAQVVGIPLCGGGGIGGIQMHVMITGRRRGADAVLPREVRHPAHHLPPVAARRRQAPQSGRDVPYTE